jgi:hypothetical protein
MRYTLAGWRREMGWQIGCIGELPAVAGCYALYVSGKLFYIGSTANFDFRLKHHELIEQIPINLLSLKFKRSQKYGDWLMLELRMIRRLKPPGNIAGLQSGSRIKVKEALTKLLGVEVAEKAAAGKLSKVGQCKWCNRAFRRRRNVHDFCSKECRFNWHNDRAARAKLVLDNGQLVLTRPPPGERYIWRVEKRAQLS